jgi:putative flippase GtrA
VKSAAPRRHQTQIPRFIGVGLASTAVHYVVLTTAVEFGGWWPTPATATGFIAGAIVNYLLNRSLTFRSGRAHRQGLPRFAIMFAIGWTLNTLLVWWLAPRLWHYLLAQVIATGVVLVFNYLTLNFWVFRAERDSTPPLR